MLQPLALHEMNYFELCDKLRLPDEEFEEWMKALGLIHSSMTCDRCQEPMRSKEEADTGFVKKRVPLWTNESK